MINEINELSFLIRIQASERRLKLFDKFRKLSTLAGFAFLQEKNSWVDDKKK